MLWVRCLTFHLQDFVGLELQLLAILKDSCSKLADPIVTCYFIECIQNNFYRWQEASAIELLVPTLFLISCWFYILATIQYGLIKGDYLLCLTAFVFFLVLKMFLGLSKRQVVKLISSVLQLVGCDTKPHNLSVVLPYQNWALDKN